MTELLPSKFDERSDLLFIHFDVDEHFLKLDTFIETAESTRQVIESLNSNFFQGALEYELIVLPPADGTFLSKLALYLSGGVAFIFTFLNSDVGSAYVKGLTGKLPTELAEEIGNEHKEQIENFRNFEAPIDEDVPEVDQILETPTSLPDEEIEEACRAGAQIVVAMTRGVLEKSNEELNEIGMEIGDLHDAMRARAEFYSACIQDRDVKRIGFSEDNDFPIPRNQFPERAQKPPRREQDDKPPEWVVSIENIYVTSPNWDKEDQTTRQWKGKDSVRRDCYFVIEDDEFWQLVKRKDLHVEGLDNLKVQWAYQVVDGRPKNRRVLRVLEFNGDWLTKPLEVVEIRSILGDYAQGDIPRRQRSLFDDNEN